MRGLHGVGRGWGSPSTWYAALLAYPWPPETQGMVAPGWRTQPMTSVQTRALRRLLPSTVPPKYVCAHNVGSQK